MATRNAGVLFSDGVGTDLEFESKYLHFPDEITFPK